MAKEIIEVSIDIISTLLNDGYVISKRKYLKDDSKEIGIFERNILQLTQENKKLYLINFDSFGNKIKKSSNIIQKNSILELLKIDKDGTRSHYKQIITYHKQRVSKKSLDPSIVDEASSKLLVYDWLLKKYPRESDVIVPEITLGDRRADYIAFGENETCIIEIKSEVDTLDRLQKQIDRYVSYGSYVYIAIHASKIDRLKKIDIPSCVGILEINKKLKLIKRPKKKKIDFNVFLSHLSYNDFKGMPFGMKLSSKFTKEDIEDIFINNFTSKQKAKYSLDGIKTKCRYESSLRKQFHINGDKEKSIDSAKAIGVNRLQNTITSQTLIQSFNLKANYLVLLMQEMEKQYDKIYVKYKYADLILDDSILFKVILDTIEPFKYRMQSKYFRLKIMIEERHLFLSNKTTILKLINDNIISMIDAIRNRTKYYFISTRSKLSVNLIVDNLAKLNINSEFVKNLDGGWTNKVNDDMFNGKNILITTINKHVMYSLEDNIKQIYLWGSKKKHENNPI